MTDLRSDKDAGLRFGRVSIVGGRWKGRAGIYDDDRGPYCVVYPDGAIGYVLVRPSSLIEAREAEETIH